jgi:hypothetical protein
MPPWGWNHHVGTAGLVIAIASTCQAEGSTLQFHHQNCAGKAVQEVPASELLGGHET